MQRLRNSFRSPQWLLYKLLIIRSLYPPPQTEESVCVFVKYAVITFTIRTFTKCENTKISCPLQVAKRQIFHLGKIISYLSKVSVLQELVRFLFSAMGHPFKSRPSPAKFFLDANSASASMLTASATPGELGGGVGLTCVKIKLRLPAMKPYNASLLK